MRFVKAAVVGLCVLGGAAVQAQEVVMGLDQAIQVALVNNSSIIQSDANASSAAAGLTAAYGGYLPSVSASGGWNRWQTDRAAASTASVGGGTFLLPPSRTTTTSFTAGLSAGLVLFDGLSKQALVGQAGSRSDAAVHATVRTRQSIVFQVQSNYLDVLRNGQLVKVADETLKRDQRQLERITESNKVGSAAMADVYRQQSAVATDELSLITSQNSFDKARTNLVALVGLDSEKEYTFADSSIALEIEQADLDSTTAHLGDFAGLSKRALLSRPDYLEAKESFDAASSGVTMARSGYFPSLSASVGYGLSSDQLSSLRDNKTINWGLNLRWTIFDGFQTNLSLQSAIAGRRIAEISLVQAERDINAQLKNALLDLEAARKQYEVSQKGVVSASEDSKIAEERYNLGAGTLLDLYTANTTLVSAQANLVNSVYNYVTAKRNVEYMLGERSY